jgi:hypothetical protein
MTPNMDHALESNTGTLKGTGLAARSYPRGQQRTRPWSQWSIVAGPFDLRLGSASSALLENSSAIATNAAATF